MLKISQYSIYVKYGYFLCLHFTILQESLQFCRKESKITMLSFLSKCMDSVVYKNGLRLLCYILTVIQHSKSTHIISNIAKQIKGKQKIMHLAQESNQNFSGKGIAGTSLLVHWRIRTKQHKHHNKSLYLFLFFESKNEVK